jgi:hypothetical protein
MPLSSTQLANAMETDYFLVVHPLDDIPEQKLNSDHLPPMEMTNSVRWSLICLRVYLLLMIGLFLYHVFDPATQLLTKR